MTAQAATTEAPTFPAASLDRRFYAFAIDRLIAWPLIAAAAFAAYWFFFSEDRIGARHRADRRRRRRALGRDARSLLGLMGISPGKALLGLRVVHLGSGTPIGMGPALLRTLIVGASALPTFGLGLATLAWTAVMDPGHQRRGWHDNVDQLDRRRRTPGAGRGGRGRPRAAARRQPDRDAAGPGAAARAGRRSRAAPRDRPRPRRPYPSNSHRITAPERRPEQPAPQPPAPNGGRPGVLAPTPRPTTPPDEAPAERTRPRAQDAGSAALAGHLRRRFETFVVEGLALVGRRPEPRPGEPVQPRRAAALGGHVALEDARPVPGGARR